MNSFTLSHLRDTADQLSLLAGAFQTKPFYLRAKQIRQADKALICADAVFTKQLALEAKQWKDAIAGLSVLEKKLELFNEKQEEIDELDEKIFAFKSSTKSWFELEEAERNRIILNSKRAKDYLTRQHENAELHTLHRYKRFLALRDLAPYSDNASYLCESLYHFENREKYENNIIKLEEKKSKANERLKTVQRGFWLAILFCVFVITIPICFPFAISLWRRKREIESQIVNTEETLRRENKRLIAADEGAVVSQEIRDLLGEVSLEDIREVLVEVKDLRSEFLGPERTASPTALLLSFISTNKTKLVEIFGEMPEEPVHIFRWLCEKVDKYQNTQAHILQLEEKKSVCYMHQTHLIKGYSKEKLVASVYNLKEIVTNCMKFPFEESNRLFFADVCIALPQVLSQIREVLYYVSKNQQVDITYWDNLGMRIQSFANTMALCILEAEIFQPAHTPAQPHLEACGEIKLAT